jgi:hypothetical protein
MKVKKFTVLTSDQATLRVIVEWMNECFKNDIQNYDSGKYNSVAFYEDMMKYVPEFNKFMNEKKEQLKKSETMKYSNHTSPKKTSIRNKKVHLRIVK